MKEQRDTFSSDPLNRRRMHYKSSQNQGAKIYGPLRGILYEFYTLKK